MGENKGFVKTITCMSRCWIPVNVHAPIKDCTEPFFIHYCVFVWTSENDKKKKNATCGRGVLEGGKKCQFSSNYGLLYGYFIFKQMEKNGVIRSQRLLLYFTFCVYLVGKILL